MTTRRAFTVVELLVTIGVLSLIAAFTIPTYQLILAQQKLNSAAEGLADYLMLTQQKTVTEQLLYGVTFTAGASTVPQYLYTPASPGNPATKTSTGTYALPSDIVISSVNFSGNADVRFLTSAAPNVNGNVVLRDTVRNRYKRVSIGPAGLISAKEAEF